MHEQKVRISIYLVVLCLINHLTLSKDSLCHFNSVTTIIFSNSHVELLCISTCYCVIIVHEVFVQWWCLIIFPGYFYEIPSIGAIRINTQVTA